MRNHQQLNTKRRAKNLAAEGKKLKLIRKFRCLAGNPKNSRLKLKEVKVRKISLLLNLKQNPVPKIKRQQISMLIHS